MFEAIAAERLPVLNAFHRPCGRLPVTIAGEALWIGGTEGNGRREAAPQYRMDVSVGGENGYVTFPTALVDAWIAKTDRSADPNRLTPELRALLVEAAVAGELEWLERVIEAPIEIRALDADAGGASGDVFFLTGSYRDNLARMALALPDAVVTRISETLAAYAPAEPLPGDLPIPVTVVRSAATITLGALETLAPGQVVMFEDDDTFKGAAWALVAGHLAIPVTVTDTEIRPIAPSRPVRGSKWEWTMNQHDNPPGNQPVEDASLSELPVTLTFELGRTSMSLEELRRVGPGSVIQLSGVRTETVDVMSGGKRIGSGEIVRIGSGLGVRVTRIFDKNA